MINAGAGHGSDIALQREDDLDSKAIQFTRQVVSLKKQATILDIGAGRGAQAARLLEAGATFGVAADIVDFSEDFATLTKNIRQKAVFIKTDVSKDDFARAVLSQAPCSTFDTIVFQRTVHYFPYREALIVLSKIRELMSPESKIFMSASGLNSELANSYAASHKPVESRFGPLSSIMSVKHGIHAPVCLYSQKELIELCSASGLRVIEAYKSAFGNVKIIATRQ